jgi:serine/threonine protein kinase
MPTFSEQSSSSPYPAAQAGKDRTALRSAPYPFVTSLRKRLQFKQARIVWSCVFVRDFLMRLLSLDPNIRPTAAVALAHSWLSDRKFS